MTTDKTVSTERLREQGVEVLRRLSSAKVSLSDASFIAGWVTKARTALASHAQSPAAPVLDLSLATPESRQTRQVFLVEPAKETAYAVISKVVFDCRERQKRTGESDQMLSRWIAEALSALETPPLHKEGEAEWRRQCASSGFHDHDGCSCSEEELRARFAVPVAVMDGEIAMLFSGLRRNATPDNTLRLDRLEALYAAPVPVPVTITDEMADAALAKSRDKALDTLTNTEAMRQIILAAFSKAGEQG